MVCSCSMAGTVACMNCNVRQNYFGENWNVVSKLKETVVQYDYNNRIVRILEREY